MTTESQSQQPSGVASNAISVDDWLLHGPSDVSSRWEWLLLPIYYNLYCIKSFTLDFLNEPITKWREDDIPAHVILEMGLRKASAGILTQPDREILALILNEHVGMVREEVRWMKGGLEIKIVNMLKGARQAGEEGSESASETTH